MRSILWHSRRTVRHLSQGARAHAPRARARNTMDHRPSLLFGVISIGVLVKVFHDETKWNHAETRLARLESLRLQGCIASTPDVGDMPFMTSLPSNINPKAYQKCLELALQYAKAGVEGTIRGHTLVIGAPDTLLELGTRCKFDPFLSGQGSILLPEDADGVRRHMNADGMTLIDGWSGAPIANGFFTNALSKVGGGGARSRSAHWIANKTSCVVIKISEDTTGEVTIFCNGQQLDFK